MSASDFAAIGINASTVSAVYLWAMGSVLASYFLGWVIGLAVDLIRKI